MAHDSQEKPHYLGHRQRLRERFLQHGHAALADYELLEMVLFSARPRGDVKPLAKKLLQEFGSFAKVITASQEKLMAVEGVSEAVVAAIRTVHAAAERMLREEIQDKPLIKSWSALLNYAKTTMGFKEVEEFRILFLNKRNELIKDELQQKGTVDHTPIYTREVVKRALELNACSLVLMHNHPSGDANPSKADIDITNQVVRASSAMGISVHDHLIITKTGHFSFRANGII